MHSADRRSLDAWALDHLLSVVQEGVVARRQLVELGARDHDIARMLRRRDLVAVHRGVFVNHTGALSWTERAWAAVLVHWPAALTLESALPRPGPDGPIHVAIDMRRSVTAVNGVQAHRTTDLSARVNWARRPPRVFLEHAVIDVASMHVRQPLAMYRTLADACQTRETSALRIAEVLSTRTRVPGKRMMIELLSDLTTGACSVLEREYHNVERAHGLPAAHRQHRTGFSGRARYRDVDYTEYGLLVELDGRAFHDNAVARDDDAERDLDARVDDHRTTVRVTYGLVFGSPCRTAHRLGVLLQRGGWTGSPTRCARCPGS